MNRADREAWQSARTFADLCELTARWIEGSVGEQPGYCGPTDIEDPEMTPVLAALCRAGYMTTCSQAGRSWLGGNGEHWEQLAAVEGFTDAGTASRIVNRATAAGLAVIACEPAPRHSRRVRYDRAVTVTWLNGQPFTVFGARIPGRDLRDPHVGYGTCDRAAVRELCAARQVTVIDPMPCRPEYLWNTLARTLIPGKAS